jgi:signal transduction histidine kinase
MLVDLRRSEGGLRLLVCDRGPGISAEDRDKIFQKFGQGSARPTAGEKSVGLGLWIVQRVVADLGGRVWCRSDPGHGATFGVELPPGPAAGGRLGRDQALANGEPHEVSL